MKKDSNDIPKSAILFLEMSFKTPFTLPHWNATPSRGTISTRPLLATLLVSYSGIYDTIEEVGDEIGSNH